METYSTEKTELSPQEQYRADTELRRTIDRIMDERKKSRKGARVFCVGCGGGQRTPLRRWHNSYICINCWKMKEAIGEDAFILRVKNNLLGE